MSNAVRVAKIGKSAYSLDPRDFVLHTDYNTFKIMAEGVKDVTIPGSSSSYEVVQAHGLPFVPLVVAFVREGTETGVYTVNGGNVYLYGVKTGITYSTKLVKVKADATNIKFYFDSTSGDKTVHIKYFCIEAI